jgi:arginase
LLDRLRDAGVQLHDCGDLPVQRWRPDRSNQYAQNLDQVIEYATRTAAITTDRLRAGDLMLVVGGDCTVGLGTLAGVKAAGQPRLVYLDMHPDLNVPASATDGALDWMGIAHALGHEKAIDALSGFAGDRPLLRPQELVVIGYEESQATSFERALIREYSIATVACAQMLEAPELAARQALASVPEDGLLLVHFDVDVIDFIDCPLSENTGRNVGVTLEAATSALAALCADPRLVALTITELNPLHAEADPTALPRLVDALVAALGGQGGP